MCLSLLPTPPSGFASISDEKRGSFSFGMPTHERCAPKEGPVALPNGVRLVDLGPIVDTSLVVP